MRKTITVVLAVGLIVGAFMAPGADAKKKKKPKTRTATASYDAPALGVGDAGGICGLGCVPFPTTPKENYVSVKVVDASGLPVAFNISQDANGDGQGDGFNGFCGQSPKVPIQAGTEIDIFIWAVGGTGAAGTAPQCQGAATTGDITAVFSAK